MANVLIVDDETGLRKTMQQFLLRDGHEVQVAEQAEIALEMLAGGEFEIVISDIILPRMNGIELLHCIQADYPHILVILITGEPSVTTASEAVRARAFDYLAKPIPKNMICQAVSRAENELNRRKKAQTELSPDAKPSPVPKGELSASWVGRFLQVSPIPSFLYRSGRVVEANSRMKKWIGRFGSATFSMFSFWPEEERKRIELAFEEVEQQGAASRSLDTVLRFPNTSVQSVQMVLLRVEIAGRTNVLGQFHPSGDKLLSMEESVSGLGKPLEKFSKGEKVKRLEVALNESGLGFWEMDLPSATVRYSSQWTEMIGYSVDEIPTTQKAWEKMIHPDDRARVLDLISNYLDGTVPKYETEFRLKTKRGQWKWILAKAHIVERDADGTPIWVVGTHQDIDSQKRLVRVARESEYRFEALFENSVQGTCLFDTSGQLIHVNQKLTEITGFSKYDLTQMTERQLVHPDDYDEGARLFSDLIEGRRNEYLQEKRYLKSNGDAVWVELFATSIRNEENQVTAAIGIVLDITDRKRAIATLEKKEMRLRMASRGGEVGFWDWNLDTDEVFISEEYAHMLGYEDDELPSDPRSLLNLIHLDDKPRFIRTMYRHFEGETDSFSIESRMKSKKGEPRWLVFRGRVVERNDLGRPMRFAGSIVDITEKKALQDALHDSEQKLSTLVGHLPDYIAIIDSKHTIRFINRLPKLIETFPNGGVALTDVLHPRFHFTFVSALKKCFEGRAVSPFEIEGKDGEILLTRLEPLEIENRIAEVMVIATPISKLKRRARTFEETRTKYQALFEYANDAILIHDFEGKLLDANERASQLLGYSKQALQKMHWNQISVQKRSQAFGSVLETGSGVHESTLLTSNGTPIAFEINSRLIHNDGHQVVISIARDLSESVQAKQDRRNLISIIENSNEFVGVADLDGRVTYVNEAGRNMVGLESDEAVRATRIFDFVPDELRKVISDVTIPIILSNRMYENQSVLRHFKTGKLIDVVITTFPLKSEMDVNPAGIATIIRDISDFKRNEQRLKESEERFRIVADATSEAVFLHRDGIVIDANREASSMFDAPRDRIVGKKLLEVLGREECSEFESETILGSVPHRVHLKRRNGETFLVEIQSKTLADVEPPMEISILRDLTVQENERRHRYRMQSMAAQIGQDDAISQLAASVAREFSNLLIDIKGSLSLARMDRRIDDSLKGIFSEIDQPLRQASDLVSRLLTFSRRQFVRPVSIDPNVVLERMQEAFEGLSEKDVDVELDLVRPLARILVDEKQLETAFLNLTENAVEAMPEGGLLRIGTGGVTLDEEFCDAHPDVRVGNYVQVTFADTGVGMDSQTKHRAFDPFFTTKTDSANIGFGLSSVYGIVRQCQGAIELQSQPGKGTKVSLYFPVGSDTEKTSVERNNVKASLDGNETILFVEEEQAVRNVVSKLFEKHGYRVLTADSAQAAISSALEHEGEIHALVTAVVLDDVDGFTVARQIRGKYPEIKELFTSGYPKSFLAFHYPLPEREFELLPKPFSPMDVLRRLRYLLGEKKRT